MKKPQPIHSVLEQILRSLEIDVPLKSYTIWGAWKEIVGDSVALQAQPRAIRNRILFIDVSHSTWMQQLQFLKPTLLEKINAFLGQPLLQDIRFRLGKISQAVSLPPRVNPLEEEKLGNATLNQIESVLQKIEDQEVRKSLRNVLIKGAKLEHRRKKSK
ncbi:MAG: DciA family protein [Thermodesulfobacteriota bacterium]